MPVSTRLFAIALVATAALGLAACGGTVIDDQKAEDAIQTSLESDGKIKVDTVDCPSDVDVKAGETFECEVVSMGGEKATVTLKIRNDDADVSFVSVKPHK